MVMKIKTEDAVDTVDMPQPQTTQHARASSLALPFLLGGTMKQRQASPDPTSSPQTSASALTFLDLRSLATATADTLVGARSTSSKTKSKRSNEHALGLLAALALRALFLLALVAFLRALFGLNPLPLSFGPFSGPVTPSADYLPPHQRAFRALRAAHEHFDHGHQLAIDTDGYVSLAHDFDQIGLPDSSRISAKWPWAARKAGGSQLPAQDEGSGPADGVPGLKAESAEPPAGAGVKDDGPPLGEGSVVHPLRVHLPFEEARRGDGGQRRHGRGRGVRYSY